MFDKKYLSRCPSGYKILLAAIPEATAVAPETVEHLLKQLCGKLGQCRK
jgi:hypothetical protein